MTLEAFKSERKSVKAGMTRIANFVAGFDPAANSCEELFVRKGQLIEFFKRYDTVQTKLEALDFDTHSLDRDEVETKYFRTLATINSSTSPAAIAPDIGTPTTSLNSPSE